MSLLSNIFHHVPAHISRTEIFLCIAYKCCNSQRFLKLLISRDVFHGSETVILIPWISSNRHRMCFLLLVNACHYFVCYRSKFRENMNAKMKRAITCLLPGRCVNSVSLELPLSFVLASLHQLMVICQIFKQSIIYITNLEQTSPTDSGFGSGSTRGKSY